MDDKLILIVVTYYVIAIVSIVLVLNLIEYLNKKKFKHEIEDLDIEKNQIIDAPIMTELSKVESLVRQESIKEKYNVWKKEVDELKKDMDSSINDMILDADFLLDKKDYSDYIKKKISIEIRLYEAKEKKQRVLEEIKEITLSEERNRVTITDLKLKFREIVRNFELNKDSFMSIDKVVDLQIETIEKRFQDFEYDMENQDYVAANKLIKVIDTLIKHLDTIVDEIPAALLMSENIIPKRLDDMKNEYDKMVMDGYQLDYLNIEYNIEEINKKISDIMSRIRVLNLEDVLFELRTILEYTDSVYTDFEREKISRKEYEETITLFKSKVKRINEIMNKLYGKVVDAKYNYKLSDDELKNLDNLSDELILLDEDFNKLHDATKNNSFPYSRLNKELELLVIKLSKVEESLQDYIDSIGNMQEDEKRAREQLADMKELLEQSKAKIREYKLPYVPDSYFIELKEAIESIREVNKELDSKPINIEVLNTRVDTARDLIFKIYNNSNEIIKSAILAENAIVYGNRYRAKKTYVDEGLNKAEMLFNKGDYKKSLELSLNTIDIIEPGIYKKFLNKYEKNSK